MIAQFLMLTLAAMDIFTPDQNWVCETDLAQICGEDGCISESRPAEISFFPSARLYRLCIDDDCQDGSATFYAYRGSIVVKFDDEPGYARMFPDLSFMQITETGKTVQISRGSCTADDPPTATDPNFSPI